MPQTRQLAAIMFTDIVGYTALMGNDEEKAFAVLNKNRGLQKPIIAQFNGHWIKEIGDGVLASFHTVADAVYAAVKIQDACNVSKEFQLRIGIHLGDILFENDDVFGDGVNIASRIQAIAEPGSIYISESVRNNISNKKDIQTKFVKEETLKNVKEVVKLYEVITANAPVPPGSTTQAKKITTQEKSIAVLPFANMSSDPEQEYFSDGISEEIINMLAQVPGLKVAGRTSSFSFKGKNQDLRLIGEQLNVNHILEGSVRKSGNKLRITAQLIKVADGYHLYSEKFDRELDDIFEIQDEISMEILNAIKIKLVDTEKEEILKRYTNNTEAYQLYLQGRYHVNKYNGKEAFTNGIKYYEAAIQVAPDYALAYAGIAYCYFELWMDSLLPPEQCLPQLNHAVKRSMQLDDTIAESHLALADLKLFCEWDLKTANKEFQKVLELNPNSAEGNAHYAMYHLLCGNYKESCRLASISHALEPFSLQNNWEVAWTFFHSQQADKAVELGRSMIQMEPVFFGGHFIAGNILMYEKKYAEARPLLETAARLFPDYFTTLRSLATLYWKMNNEAGCHEMLMKMEALGNKQTIANSEMGMMNAVMGKYEIAAAYFEKAFEKREPLMLFAKDTLMALDETLYYVPQIEKVLEKVEAFKKK